MAFTNPDTLDIEEDPAVGGGGFAAAGLVIGAAVFGVVWCCNPAIRDATEWLAHFAHARVFGETAPAPDAHTPQATMMPPPSPPRRKVE